MDPCVNTVALVGPIRPVARCNDGASLPISATLEPPSSSRDPVFGAFG